MGDVHSTFVCNPHGLTGHTAVPIAGICCDPPTLSLYLAPRLQAVDLPVRPQKIGASATSEKLEVRGSSLIVSLP